MTTRMTPLLRRSRLPSLRSTQGFSACAVQRECGGCPLMPLGQPKAEESKLRKVSGALRQHGVEPRRPATWMAVTTESIGTRPARVDPADGPALGYRNRMRVQVNRHATSGQVTIGVVPGVTECPVVTPSVSRLLGALDHAASLQPASFHDIEDLDHIEIRGADSDGLSLVVIHRDGDTMSGSSRDAMAAGALMRFKGLLQECLGDFDEDEEDFEVVDAAAPRGGVTSGVPLQRFQVGDDGTYVLVPPTSFVQVNPAMNRTLVRRVCDLAQASLPPSPPEGTTAVTSVLDLFCGTGNYSLPLLAGNPGLHIHGIEWSQDAIDAAQLAAQQQGLSARATFEAGSVPDVATRLLEQEAAQYDVVICNPPRAGLKPATAKAVAQLAREAIVYVACNPATLAADLNTVLSASPSSSFSPALSPWILQEVRALDMFPNTKHVESCAWLTKDHRRRGPSSRRAHGQMIAKRGLSTTRRTRRKDIWERHFKLLAHQFKEQSGGNPNATSG